MFEHVFDEIERMIKEIIGKSEYSMDLNKYSEEE